MDKSMKDLCIGFSALRATPQSIARVLDIPLEEVLKCLKRGSREKDKVEKVDNVVV
jgi:hypothetical protein